MHIRDLIGPSLYMPWITHMLFVDLNDNFSCQEFDRLLCICSVKGCRENTMRKTTSLVGAVTLPATGVDKTDNLPSGITEILHMPQLIMVFTSFDAFILPFKTLSNNVCVIGGI